MNVYLSMLARFYLSKDVLIVLLPISIIFITLLTHRIIPSLCFGILLGSVLHTKTLSISTFNYLFKVFLEIFIQDNQIVSGKIELFLFFIVLGTLTRIFQIQQTFTILADLVIDKLSSIKKAQTYTMLLNMMLFIDDYFSSLVTGNVFRNVYTRLGIPRTKLAYLLDSTSAPVSVLIPISTWGSMLIGIFSTFSIPSNTPFHSLNFFFTVAMYNFYPIITLLTIGYMHFFDIDFFPMKQQTLQARKNISIYQQKKSIIFEIETNTFYSLLPFFIFAIGSFFFLFGTGIINIMFVNKYHSVSPQRYHLLNILQYANVNSALLSSSFLAVIVNILLHKQSLLNFQKLTSLLREGFYMMYETMLILTCAWMFSTIMGDLKLSTYISNYLYQQQYLANFLPAIIFVLSSFISFATGTSWGTFALLLPIVADITQAHVLPIFYAGLGACMSGAVFGDHISPVSDTTILAAKSAGCTTMQHFLTQYPYCILFALQSFFAYFIWGYTLQISTALLFTLSSGFLGIFLYQRIYSSNKHN